MDEIKELDLSEIVNISGGSEIAYEIGYAMGCAIRQFLLIGSLVRYLA
jgi:hypothetical protein